MGVSRVSPLTLVVVQFGGLTTIVNTGPYDIAPNELIMWDIPRQDEPFPHRRVDEPSGKILVQTVPFAEKNGVSTTVARQIVGTQQQKRKKYPG